ncbi:hypothetical protein ACF07T_40080 [Streptomyces sp. NPDC015184]|uniref:hypothetical protein n=1 Tax=Streptomyces sp. NPDC015184 TaxID=3364946 RepID=UPI0036F756F8
MAIELRWKLTADNKERAALEAFAKGCADTVVKYEVAPWRLPDHLRPAPWGCAAGGAGCQRLQWWIRVAEWIEVRFGTSRAGAAFAPLHRTTDVDAHPEIDREELRQVEEGRRSPLVTLRPKPETAPA